MAMLLNGFSAAMTSTDSIPLTWNEALSGIFGSASIAAWIFLLVPQLLENYRLGSADGISTTFLLIWFLGDVTNLAGAIWAGLVPTATALAVYFCFADVTLLAQCAYYNALNKKLDEAALAENARTAGEGSATANGSASTEQTPLLGQNKPTSPTQKRHLPHLTDITDENLGLPGSRRRSSATSATRLRRSTTHSTTRHDDTLAQILEERPTNSTTRTVIKNTLSILAILAIGAGGWALAWRAGAWKPTPVNDSGKESDPTPLGAEILGYLSAVLYLGARIPQIVKNQRERSCEGLSLLFFLLSLIGNATYGAGILFHSVEKQYFMTNLPWLIGSLGTMAEDAVIFVQFSVFGEQKKEVAIE